MMVVAAPQRTWGNEPNDRPPQKTENLAKPSESEVPAVSVLEAMRDGKVAVQAEGIGDGRMTVSLTTRTRRQIRVVLPPGIIAQGATGQFGGMGGMGGGMMGGMGGMIGGMGGGMRSVPPTDLPSALLKPGQSRHLPTRLVSVTPPDPQQGLVMPEKGERLRIVGDISHVNENPEVSKALKRLAADKAPASIAQLVMWRLVAGLDWDQIADVSKRWSNDYELTLAREFVERLDRPADGETGHLRIELHGDDAASASIAADAAGVLKGKMVLGLTTEIGMPERPDGPTVGCRVRLGSGEAHVQVMNSDANARNWVAVGKFSIPIIHKSGKFDANRFADDLVAAVLNRLVRARLAKGPRARGKLTYQIQIENASPLILNGFAAVGAESVDKNAPNFLSGICISPRRSMTVPASEEAVKSLGLKKGIRLVALDLSGL